MLEVIVKPLNPLEKPPFDPEKSLSVDCLSCTLNDCPDDCGGYVPSTGPIIFPPPPPMIHVTSEKYHMPFYFILMLCVLGAVFLFICYMIIVKRNRNSSRIRRNGSELGESTREDFVMDENVGPVVDHPIWYIRTVGLGQDVIDSISVFKYKKDECLIEGSDCSVCLTEFEEDESLRLLPKCSHAFHVPCIDTWLRSHKNCPLCRAPIVSDIMDNNAPITDHVVEVVSITSDHESSPNDHVVRDNEQLENLESDEEGNQETRRGSEDEEEEEEGRRIMDLSMKIPRVVDGRRKGVRVHSDLADHQHRVKLNNFNEHEPARRSVSMDSSAAQVIHLAINEMNSEKIEGGCSSSKRGDRNSSLYKAMKSSSFGRSLQNMPIISLKRSFSTTGKCSLPTSIKIQDLRQTM